MPEFAAGQFKIQFQQKDRERKESTAGLPFSVYTRILDGLYAIIQQNTEGNEVVEGMFSEIRSEGGEESSEDKE